MREEILQLFVQKEKLTLEEIRKEIKTGSAKQLTDLIKTLNSLEDERLIINNHAYYYAVKEDDVIGKIKDVSRFEYAVINKDRKVYVEKKYGKNVFDNDEVLAGYENGNWKIKHIFTHGIYRITGSFIQSRGKLVFHSDVDYHREIVVKNLKQFKVKANDKVVVTIEKYENPLIVNIESIIGNVKEAGVDITSILMENKVRMEFSDKVAKEVSKIPMKVTEKEKKGRSDLRFLPTVTIDGDDARDFDDAISVIKNDNGYTLYVHIADVSHYVKEGSAIDNEAYNRCTSIYVCDRVIPMLPFELSNGICSLNENVERNTITCQMSIDENGNCYEYDVYPSVIYSDRRCTYTMVNRVLAGDEEALELYSNVKEMLLDMAECAKLVQKKSIERGNIEFDSKEAVIKLNKKGKAVDVYVKERGFSEQIIEEFMILANVCVANCLNSQDLPCMYRVHEDPSLDNLKMLEGVCRQFGLDIDINSITPKSIQQLLDGIEDKATFDCISKMALRCMQKAYYSNNCIGHFGLSLDEYCHFTSPIRRYSDLVVHRMLRKYIFSKADDLEKDIKKIGRQANQMSEKERDAITVERKVEDYKMSEYMENHIGETFYGTIVNILEFGFFIQLDNTIEGLVPVRTLDGFYTFDEKQLTLSNGIITYRLGQKVKVICSDVNKEKGQIGFEIPRKRRF